LGLSSEEVRSQIYTIDKKLSKTLNTVWVIMKIIFEREIEAQKIIVSPRPVWKCRACPMYGKTPSCPPHVPSWKETLDWIKCFQTAIIVKFETGMNNFEREKRETLTCLLEKEKDFFAEGYPFTFALFPGNCNLCDTCGFEKGKGCLHPTRVRPSVDAIGIEVSSFIKIDFSENVLYGLILIN